jgi:class 3 adenylate cyclase
MRTANDITEREVTVLFTDICGYTAFVAKKGSAAAHGLRIWHDSLIKPIISQFGGVYLKSTGDGLIAYFQAPIGAVDAAVKIQEAVDAYDVGKPQGDQVHIRVGIQQGTAVIEEGEIVGNAVNFASRLVGVCRPDQILIGREAYRKLKRIRHITLKRIGSTVLQGIPQPEEVFEVGWQFEALEPKEKGRYLPETKGRFSRGKYVYALAAAFLLAVLVGWLIFRGRRAGTPNRAGALSPISSVTTSVPEERRVYDQALRYLSEGDDEKALKTLDDAINANQQYLEPYYEAAFVTR